MRAAYIAIFAGALAAGTAAGAADRPCGKAEAAAAQKSVDRVESWASLEKAWRDYRQCDSGDVADVYTDALLRLIVDWKDVSELNAAMAKDPQYRDFVLAHLRSDAAKDDRPTVYSRAKASCPSGLDAFCTEIAGATKGAAAASKMQMPDFAPLQPIGSAPAKPEAGKAK
jgi:hypothetical protein